MAWADNLPHWLYSKCSYEIADLVAHVYSCSLMTGKVPEQWRIANVTPIPKTAKPESIKDFRPISVTSIASRVLERLIVNRFIRPGIPDESLIDQFAFRPSGSTTCALVNLMHQVHYDRK